MKTKQGSSESLLSPAAARALSGGISESTVRRLIAAGKYPRPVVISRCRDGRPARVAFVESEVRTWAAEVIYRDRSARSDTTERDVRDGQGEGA
jgi:predicted DNA-binding transcriptional regulator AlpA